MVSATPRWDSPAINLSTWHWGVDWDEVIGKAVSKVIKLTLDDDPPGLALPFRHTQAGYPLAIRLLLPFAATDSDYTEWEVPFSALIEDLIEWHECGDGGKINADDAERVFDPVIREMKRLIAMLEDRFDKSEPA